MLPASDLAVRPGGTGIFKGATGTIKAKAITNKKEAVTITYST